MVSKLDVLFFDELNLLDKIFCSIKILEIKFIFIFVSHSHKAFLLSESYPLKVQLFSHKDKLLFINSFFLSFIIISVPSSVVYA